MMDEDNKKKSQMKHFFMLCFGVWPGRMFSSLSKHQFAYEVNVEGEMPLTVPKRQILNREKS